uniref:Uncharacterized protein n=1 Tax=Rhizophora mucronata TaxID=61149 RepID=A0A2P2MRZ6_RHIMU
MIKSNIYFATESGNNWAVLLFFFFFF